MGQGGVEMCKILVNNIKPRPETIYQHMDEWKNDGRSGRVIIPRIHTNQTRNISKGSKDHIGASILGHDKATNTMEQEAHNKVRVCKTLRHFILKCCRYSSLKKFEDAFDTALELMQTKPLDVAFSAIFRVSINANQKQLVTSFLARL